MRIYIFFLTLILPISLLYSTPKNKDMNRFLKFWGKYAKGDPRKEPLHLVAGSLEVKDENGLNVWFSTEGVHLWQGSEKKPMMELHCHQAVIWVKFAKKKKKNEKTTLETAMFYAEGNVHFRWANSLIKGKRLFFDLLANKGIIKNATLKGDIDIDKSKNQILHLHIRALELFIHSRKKVEAYHASFSTCSFGVPHYDFASKRIQVYRLPKKVYVKMRENNLNALGVPLFYVPHIAGETIEHIPIKSIKYANSSKLGNHLLIKWILSSYEADTDEKGNTDAIIRKVKFFLNTDAYEKRGFALGPDLRYKGSFSDGMGFKGQFKSYYVHDKPILKLGTSGDTKKTSDRATWDDRYRMYSIYRQNLPYNWKIDGEIYHISDRDFLIDFFEVDAREDKEAETYVYAKRLWKEYAFTFLARTKINDFQSQIEYLPQGTFDVIFKPLWHDPFGSLYFSSNVSVSNVQRSDDVDAPTQLDGRRTFRFDWDNTLFYKLSVGPFFIVPFVGGRFSYFEQGIEEDNLYRGTGQTGVEVSTNFYRPFYVSHNLLQIDKILHVFTPHFRYQWIYANSVGPEKLMPFDSIETIDKLQLIQVILTNRLKTVRNGRIVDFLFVEATFSYFPEQEATDPDVDDRWERFGNLLFDFRWYIRRNLALTSKSEFNWNIREFEIANAALTYYLTNDFAFKIDARYQRQVSLTTTTSFQYKYNEKWAFKFNLQYDVRNRELREIEFTVRRGFHRFALDVSVRFDEIDNDTTISASFYPVDLF